MKKSMASFANRQNGKTSISTKSQSPFTSCRLSLHIDTIQTPTVHVTNLYKQQGLENKILWKALPMESPQWKWKSNC